jgi:hypothetical protein
MPFPYLAGHFKVVQLITYEGIAPAVQVADVEGEGRPAQGRHQQRFPPVEAKPDSQARREVPSDKGRQQTNEGEAEEERIALLIAARPEPGDHIAPKGRAAQEQTQRQLAPPSSPERRWIDNWPLPSRLAFAHRACAHHKEQARADKEPES